MPKFCRQCEYCLKNSAQDFSLPDCQFLYSGKLCIDSVPLCVCVCVCVDESEHQEGRKEHIEKHVKKIFDIQKRTRTCQENQAERKLKRRRCELQPGEVGNSVTIAPSNATVGATTACLVQINESKEQITLCPFGSCFLQPRCWDVLSLLVRMLIFYFCLLAFQNK